MLLEYTVVLYLKSNDAVKATLHMDLINAFCMIKGIREQIFVDMKWDLKLVFPGIS